MSEKNEEYIAFSKKIDCKFPYSDKVASTRLIKEGRSICLDADFLVLKEISSKGISARVTSKRQYELVAEWAAGFEHPLKEPLLQCARLHIDEKKFFWRDAVSLMERIGHFDRQYTALSIAYFAGEPDSEESEAELEAVYEQICQRWSRKGV